MVMEDFELILNNRHFYPHSFLGLHENIIRIFNPDNEKYSLIVNDKKTDATLIDKRGLFEYSHKNRRFFFLNLFHQFFHPNNRA